MSNAELAGLRIDKDLSLDESKAKGIYKEPVDKYWISSAKEDFYAAHFGYTVPLAMIVEKAQQGLEWLKPFFRNECEYKISFGWFAPLARGILIASLLGRRDVLEEISHFAATRVRLYYSGPVPDELQMMYVILLSRFQQQPNALRGFRKKVENCKKASVRDLWKILEPTISEDWNASHKAVEAAVRKFSKRKKPPSSDAFLEDWVPIHINAFYLAGLELGSPPANFPPEVAAYLMTPESVGLTALQGDS